MASEGIKYNTQIRMAVPATQLDHVPNLEQVTEMIEGKVKNPVRAASTSNVDGSYDSEGKTLTAIEDSELVLDGVVLAEGDRVLLLKQTDKTQNGIYIVTDAGSVSSAYILTRSSDFDTSSDIFPNMKVAVSEGTSNGDTYWYLSTDAPIVLDSTNLEFVLFNGEGAGVKQRVFDLEGDDTTTEYTFSHNFGTKFFVCEVYNNTTGDTEIFDVRRTSVNDVVISCTSPLGVGNSYTVVLHAEV